MRFQRIGAGSNYKKIITITAGIILLLTGCTTTAVIRVKLYPEGLKIVEENFKFFDHIGIYFAEKFKTYRWREENISELGMLDYDLGFASEKLFVQTLSHLAKHIELVSSKPPYTESQLFETTFIVEPQIVSFFESHPKALRTGYYEADIVYQIYVYDFSGQVILSKEYHGHGKVQGRAGFNPVGNYAAPVELAMKDAVSQFIRDLQTIKGTLYN